MIDLAKLERALGITFREHSLYQEALTHKSFASEHNLSFDNQRLELLGDAVVQIIFTDFLYRRYRKLQEGDLTKIRSALVNQDALAQFARDISLGDFLLLGRGEREAKGQERDSTISDAFEALMGAIYLDHGMETARDIFLSILNRHYPEPSDLLQDINPKGILQEYTQRNGLSVPLYRVAATTGPAHDPRYTVEVLIHGEVAASGIAPSHKLAERAAAKAAIQRLIKGKNEKKPDSMN